MIKIKSVIVNGVNISIWDCGNKGNTFCLGKRFFVAATHDTSEIPTGRTGTIRSNSLPYIMKKFEERYCK